MPRGCPCTHSYSQRLCGSFACLIRTGYLTRAHYFFFNAFVVSPHKLSCPDLRWTWNNLVMPLLAPCTQGQTTAGFPHYSPSPATTQHSSHKTNRSNAHHLPSTTRHSPPTTQAARTHARTHTRNKQTASKQHIHTRTHVCQKCLSVGTEPEAATKVGMRHSCARLGLNAHWMHSAVSPTMSMSCLHW